MIQHGISVLEAATSIRPPVTATAAMPVFFGTAPVHRSGNPSAAVNRPIVCFSFADAVAALGYSDDWEKFTLCEAMFRQFREYAVAPVVFVNVFDSETGRVAVAPTDKPVIDGKVEIADELADISTLVVRAEAASSPAVIEEDYTAEYMSGGLRIRVTSDGTLASATSINVAFSTVAISAVTDADILGGVDAATGRRTGIELVEDVFPMTRLVPGILAAPGWKNSLKVSHALVAKARRINGLFRAIAVVDVPDSAGATLNDVPLWKEQSGLTSPHCILCWPRVTLGDRTWHMSTEITGLLGRTDFSVGDVPYASPSNRNMGISGLSWRGAPMVFAQPQANYLNSVGIMTALNWTQGWVAWGNYTTAYPSTTDPKDMWIPVRRMFNWVANFIILTYWSRISLPIRRVLIDDIVDSMNDKFHGLESMGALLGGRIEFPPELNTDTSIMSGKITFRVFICPPTPAQEISFIMEYDPEYLSTLFGA